ncbi:hypothetical protein J3459_010224 [Metarhizium acridum]|nr:hypothetical protein J3459_010224 [Metarhizium acridum]
MDQLAQPPPSGQSWLKRLLASHVPPSIVVRVSIRGLIEYGKYLGSMCGSERVPQKPAAFPFFCRDGGDEFSLLSSPSPSPSPSLSLFPRSTTRGSRVDVWN